LKTFPLRDLLFDNPKPAEPLAFVRIGPEGCIVRPEALNLVVGFDVFLDRLATIEG